MTIRKISYITLFFVIFASICSAETETQYFALFMSGQKVGYAIQSRQVLEDRVLTTEQANITITRFNIPITMNTSETCIETTEGKPLGFEAKQDLSMMGMSVSGQVDNDGNVVAIVKTGGSEQKQTLQWPEGAVMAEGLRLITEEKGLEEGTKYTVKLFSPSLLKAIDSEITIFGKETVDLLGRVLGLTKVTKTPQR